MSPYARILLCGEGPQDIGADPYEEAGSRHMVNLEGWMQPLIRKLADCDAYLDFVRFPRSRALAMPRNRAPRSDLPGHALAAFNAMRQAVIDQCDIVVFMADNDRGKQRDRKRWREICEQVWAGFEAAGTPVCGVACIPISASEAWLLADHAAWGALGLADASDLPGVRSEAIWGERDDPDGNHPHRYFKRICRKAGQDDTAHTRNLLGEHLSLTTLEANCPVSFVPFARAMKACLANRGCLSGFDFASISPNEAPCQ